MKDLREVGTNACIVSKKDCKPDEMGWTNRQNERREITKNI